MRFNPVLIFFMLGGAALVVVSHIPAVTAFLDANSTPDSDPAAPVLQMIGWIWLAVSVIPLVFAVVAKRKGLDRLVSSRFSTSSDDAEHAAAADATLVKALTGLDMSDLTTMQAQASAAGLAGALEQLAKLHQSGQLSDEQFEQAKTQVLAAQAGLSPGST